jgi:hypothetical protein
MKITALNVIKPTSIAINNRMGSLLARNAPEAGKVPVPLMEPLLGDPQNQASEQTETAKRHVNQLI